MVARRWSLALTLAGVLGLAVEVRSEPWGWPAAHGSAGPSLGFPASLEPADFPPPETSLTEEAAPQIAPLPPIPGGSSREVPARPAWLQPKAALGPPPQAAPSEPGQSPAGPPSDDALAAALRRQAAAAHRPLFFDNDFRYLEDPCYDGWHLGDALKRHPLGSWGMVDIGGQYRLRHHSERNIRGAGLTGVSDDFLLQRWRLYSNVEVGQRFRVYAEMIDAHSSFESHPPRAIEENRFDLLNLFGEATVWENRRGELAVRIGRQELLYGAQRLVSPLDWANTRRTFEGGKVIWQGENWDVDFFWVRPMNVRRDRFDAPNQSQELMGVYATSQIWEDRTLEFYYLRFLDTDDRSQEAPFRYDTLGSRWDRSRGNWLFEAEAAVQWGTFRGQEHTHGFYTLGAGRKLVEQPWDPVLWVYYDWASGDATRGNGFHHLFPLGHRYLGWMDLFGRRNIQDINFLLTLQPSERVKLSLWHHVFFLQTTRDVPYSVAMTPLVATAGGSGYLGQELDLALEWTVTPRTDVLLGYSHFFAGRFFRTNPSAPFAGDADFFYSQVTVNF